MSPTIGPATAPAPAPAAMQGGAVHAAKRCTRVACRALGDDEPLPDELIGPRRAAFAIADDRNIAPRVDADDLGG
ncbi:MAG: hypothetical protein H0X64_04655 [Gemmatimonadaceae bacterium]|nr:hypothetical protein [Gemmatimonadaceae bacterium]